MDIVIIARYIGNINKPRQGNSRFWYLAWLLQANGHQVEIVSSDFFHKMKKHFESYTDQGEIKLTLCHEVGYPKNICLKRLWSHKGLAQNIKKYLETRRLPDLVYVAVPSLGVAYEAAKYCRKMHIPFIVDIQDIWPEAFKMVVNIPLISDIAFLPMKIMANRIYKAADEIIAVSETYLNRGKQANPGVNGVVCYLGTDKANFDMHAAKAELESHDRVRIVYVGTLGNSYDIPLIFDAMRKMQPEIIQRTEVIIMGDGPKRKIFEDCAKDLPVRFTGSLPYGEMVKQLVNCDIAVNPIVAGSAGSVINKHMDYAMAGLPIVNTQESPEYRMLLEKWKSGINCRCENSDDVAQALSLLIDNAELRTSMGQQSRKMGETLFDRKKAYQSILQAITDTATTVR